MSLNPIGLAVPFFFGLMLIEVIVSWAKGREIFRLNDGISNLTCGMGDQIIGLFFKGVAFAVYTWVYSALGLLELPMSSAWTCIVGMVGVDFFYYFYHRFSHRVNWAWATHVVHHQSEEYNLAVALRQPWFAQFFGWMFYLPMAALGLPPEVWATCYALNLLYQFWIHTRLIGRLGPMEWVMNTPSHHRVHHGTNPAYIDKNYGGILIVWDRLFGTFAQEEEEPLYGTLDPLRSWNPFWANLGPFVKIIRRARQEQTLHAKWMTWWGPPGWTAEGEVHPPFPPAGRGYDVRNIRSLGAYAVSHLLPVSIAMGLALTFEKHAPLAALIGASVYVFWSGMGWAGLYERRRWAIPLELSRLVVLAGVALLWSIGQPVVGVLLGITVMVMCVGSGLWVWTNRHALVPQAALSPGRQ